MLAHTVVHFLLPSVELLLLIVIQNIANLGIRTFMQAAHLATPVILGERSVAHYRLRLLVLVFQEGLNLGLLVRGQIELACKVFQLIVTLGTICLAA